MPNPQGLRAVLSVAPFTIAFALLMYTRGARLLPRRDATSVPKHA